TRRRTDEGFFSNLRYRRSLRAPFPHQGEVYGVTAFPGEGSRAVVLDARAEAGTRDPVTTTRAHPVFYGSVPSMFGAPISEAPEDLKAYDIAYLGIPWSAPPSAGRAASIAQFAGTSLTPNSMRTNSVKYGGYLPELDVDVFE